MRHQQYTIPSSIRKSGIRMTNLVKGPFSSLEEFQAGLRRRVPGYQDPSGQTRSFPLIPKNAPTFF